MPGFEPLTLRSSNYQAETLPLSYLTTDIMMLLSFFVVLSHSYAFAFDLMVVILSFHIWFNYSFQKIYSTFLKHVANCRISMNAAALQKENVTRKTFKK